MAITITRDLNVVSVGVPPVIHLSQYDSDFTLVFNLYASTGAFTMPTGTTAEIRGTKRDGNGYDAAASVSGSTVTVTGDEQMTAIAGQNMFEIATYYNNKRLNTINFILDVERAALDADTITSESVLRELDAIIQGAATATQAAEDAEDAADRAEEAADDLSGTVQQVATNTQDIAGLKDDLSQIVPGLSDEAKQALLACFDHVEWIGGDGQEYRDALYDALYDDIILPEGFEKSKYIEGTGQQYISTSFNSAIPMELEVELSLTEVVSGIFFGASNGGNSRFFFLGTQEYGSSNPNIYFSNRFSDTNYTSPQDGTSRAWLPLVDFIPIANKKYVVKSGIIWNQTNVTTYIESEGYRAEVDRKIPTVGYPIILGGDFWGSSTFKGLKAKIYRCKIKSGNNTIFDGVPCKRDADNKYGLYDIVNNTFYASSGSADYIGGEE